MAALKQADYPLFSLAALIVGSTIGAGNFDLSRTVAIATGPFGAV